MSLGLAHWHPQQQRCAVAGTGQSWFSQSCDPRGQLSLLPQVRVAGRGDAFPHSRHHKANEEVQGQLSCSHALRAESPAATPQSHHECALQTKQRLLSWALQVSVKASSSLVIPGPALSPAGKSKKSERRKERKTEKKNCVLE